MLEVWNPANSEDEVLVMVCRTGLNTAMGSIIGELLVPTKTALKDPVVAVCDSTLLVGALTCLHIGPAESSVCSHCQSFPYCLCPLDVLVMHL